MLVTLKDQGFNDMFESHLRPQVELSSVRINSIGQEHWALLWSPTKQMCEQWFLVQGWWAKKTKFKKKLTRASTQLIVKFSIKVGSNPCLFCFCFSSVCDWSKELAPCSPPIRCKTKTNHELRSKQFGQFCIKFSLALMIGCYDNFNFGSTMLNTKRLYW